MESWLGEGLEDLGTNGEWVNGDHAFRRGMSCEIL